MAQPPQQNQQKPSKATLWTGKRTGIRVELQPEYDEFGMENPASLFAAAQPPRRTLDLGETTTTPLNVAMLTQTDLSVEVQSVRTASPDHGKEDTTPEEKVIANQDEDDFPIAEEHIEEQEEDDFLPPPPPPMDGEDDVTESGDEGNNSNMENEKETSATNKIPNKKDEGNAHRDSDQDTDDEDEQADVQNPENDNDMVGEQNNYDDDDDGEEEGGFEMTGQESIVTPTSPNKRKRLISRKKQVRIQTPEEEEDSTEEESVSKPPPKKKKRKKDNRTSAKVTPKGRPQARTYKEIPLSAFRDDDENHNGLRRSSRVHIAPLEWWRGETYVLGPNNFGDEFDGVKNMPVVKGIKKPNPTPYKKLPPRQDTKAKSKSSKDKKKSKRTANGDIEEFDTFELEKMYEINEGESANLVNEYTEEISRTKVVSRFESQVHQDLPLPKGQRSKREGTKTGKATQCFNLVAATPGAPSFISGTLILPPKAIKDAESVLSNVQCFTVIDCQPNALELAYADPREEDNVITDETAEHFLLRRGDSFQVPAGNAYRLVNHSKKKDVILSWLIVRNTAEEEEEETYGDDEDEED